MDICLGIEPEEEPKLEADANGDELVSQDDEVTSGDGGNEQPSDEGLENEGGEVGLDFEDEGEEEEEDSQEYDEDCDHQHKPKEESIPDAKIHVLIKGNWTCASMYPMLEYLYTERCHVPCEDVADLWIAANEIMLTSLTQLIITHPLVEYLRLALKNEAYRKALLKLSIEAKSDLAPGSHMKLENYIIMLH